MEPITTILGGILGAGARLVPEVLKWLDRKDERKHELAMQDKAAEMARIQGAQKLEEGNLQYDSKGLDALIESVKAQAQPSGVRWVDAMSSLMRPLITVQWVILLYPAYLVASMIVAGAATDPAGALLKVFGADEKAIVAGIINFWFLDRVLRRR